MRSTENKTFLEQLSNPKRPLNRDRHHRHSAADEATRYMIAATGAGKVRPGIDQDHRRRRHRDARPDIQPATHLREVYPISGLQ